MGFFKKKYEKNVSRDNEFLKDYSTKVNGLQIFVDNNQKVYDELEALKNDFQYTVASSSPEAKALEKNANAAVSESVKSELCGSAPEKTAEEKDLSVLSETEKAVYLALCEQASTADLIGIKTSLSQEEILTALTMLEIYGLATSLPGGMFEVI